MPFSPPIEANPVTKNSVKNAIKRFILHKFQKFFPDPFLSGEGTTLSTPHPYVPPYIQIMAVPLTANGKDKMLSSAEVELCIFLRVKAGTAIACLRHRNSVRLSVHHTGESVKNSAS